MINDDQSGVDAERHTGRNGFGEIKPATGPLISGLILFIIAGVLMNLGSSGYDFTVYRVRPGDGPIILGVLVGLIAVISLLVAAWRFARQFYEIYVSVTRGEP